MSAARLIPWVLHELLEYALGVFLILAPFLFGMLDAPVLPLLIGAGVVLVLLQLLTAGLASIAAVVPARAHATADYLLALALVLSPFVFGFADQQDPLALVVLSGVALLLLALLTRYPLPKAEERPAGATGATGDGGAAGARPAADEPSGPRRGAGSGSAAGAPGGPAPSSERADPAAPGAPGAGATGSTTPGSTASGQGSEASDDEVATSEEERRRDRGDRGTDG